MFRHACGLQLGNQGTNTRTLQAYLGYRNIQRQRVSVLTRALGMKEQDFGSPEQDGRAVFLHR
jgi:hypothetical protein